MEKDFYKTLGVAKDATKEQISKAYRKLAKKYHPDMNPGDEQAVDKFKQVAQAYEVLGDPNKRAEYDQFGSVGGRRQQSAQQHPFNDSFFNHFFNNAFQQATRESNRGSHVEVLLEVTMKEAFEGCKKQVVFETKGACEKCMGSGAKVVEKCDNCQGTGVQISNQGAWSIQTTCVNCQGRGSTTKENCPICNGKGHSDPEEDEVTVDIPSGIDTGMQIRMQGLGNFGRQGRRGDLFVTVSVKKHEFFTRQDKHLFLDLPVSYTQLVFGTEVEVPTLKGKRELKIPAGTKSDAKFRILGNGMPDIHGGPNGDLIIVVKLEIPKKLKGEYLEIVQRLAEEEAKSPATAIKRYREKLEE